MKLSVEALMSVLAAINGAEGLTDEEKQSVAQMVTDGFSDDEDVPDDDAVAAMPAGMRAAYQASGEGAPNAEQKEAILEDGREIVRRNRSATLMLNSRKATPAGTPAPAAGDKDPVTMGALKSLLPGMMAQALTSQMRTFGARPAASTVARENADPAKGKETKASAFAARVETDCKDGSITRAAAIQYHAARDREGYSAFAAEEAAKRPDPTKK